MTTSDRDRPPHDVVSPPRKDALSRSEFLRRAAAAGIAIGTPALLAACGGGSGGDAPTNGETQPATGQAATTSAAESTPAQTGGTMRVGLPFGAASANDPAPSAVGLNARIRNWNVFDTLYWFDDEGKLVPALAEEATPNADATEWTIRIKSDVTFHDGSPLTAEDVIYSLTRILDPATKADGAGQISMIDAPGMKKVDDHTIQIPLRYPFSIFPSQLTYFTEIVKNGETAFDPPIGTGAFTWTSGDTQSVVLAKNPNYWKSGLPLLDTLELLNIADSTARLNALQTGEVDAIYPADFTQATAVQNNSDILVFTNKSGAFMPMYMNAASEPFKDNRVREALKYAADREKMNAVAYGGQGVIGNDMFGMFNPGYPTDLEQRPYDPERANALWTEAGMTGKTIQFWASDNWTGQKTHGIAFAEQAKAAGIDVEVKQVPPDQYFPKVYAIQPFASEYWYFNPILTLMSQAFIPDASYYATASWQSPETTELYTKATAETDETKRNELEAEILGIFRDTGPYIVWAYEASPDLYSVKVGGQKNSVVRAMNGLKFEEFFVTA